MIIWLTLINSCSVFPSHPTSFNHHLILLCSIIILSCLISSLSCLILQLHRSLVFKKRSYCHDAKSHAQKPHQNINITSSKHQHTNQNRLKLNVVSHTHSALTALEELKHLYKGTLHFLFTQFSSLPSKSCFFVFHLVYRSDPN